MVRFSGALDNHINIAVKFGAVLLTGHHIVAIVKEVTMLK
jgi:hypothetical protein